MALEVSSPNVTAAELRFGAEDTPLTRHAAQLARAMCVEAQPGTSHQVLHCAGDQDLAGLGQGGHARPNVDGDAADIVANRLALAAMQTTTYFQSE